MTGVFESLLVYAETTESIIIHLQSYFIIWSYFIGLLLLLLSLIINSSINQLVTGLSINYTYENDSFNQLKHSNYLQQIKFNQSNSIQLMNSEKILLISDRPLHLDTIFPIKFYGEYYKTVKILSNGIINIIESNLGKLSGSIKVFYGVWKTGQVDIIQNDKLLTKWKNMIPNGTFNETEESMPGSPIYYPTKIQSYAYSPHYKNTVIKVPAFLIKSNTLMEFIPDPICSDQTSCSECLKPGAFATKCYWCPRTRKCTNTHDSYGRMWKKGECQIQNSENCTVQNDVLTTPIQDIISITKPSIKRNKLTNPTQKITNNNLSEHVSSTTTVQNSENCTVQNDVLTTPIQDIISITKPSIKRNKLTNLTQKITNNNLSEHLSSTTTVQSITKKNNYVKQSGTLLRTTKNAVTFQDLRKRVDSDNLNISDGLTDIFE
ncbi:unnamed protein product [Schistosoma margrebowiei]|uniref:PSI domain-containing protein n=1 Tax=Schistosoma margrebowiei TaxID=48269 RepID=A0AA84ZRW8_9TREM|nr:unnamed protein product [Schistosoma margrebowiei]